MEWGFLISGVGFQQKVKIIFYNKENAFLEMDQRRTL